MESQDLRRQLENLQEKLDESLKTGNQRIEAVTGENHKLQETIKSLERELELSKEQVTTLEGRVNIDQRSEGLQTSAFVDEEAKAEVESLREMLLEKQAQIESLIQSNEQAKSHFQTEIQNKSERILCLTRELRLAQVDQMEEMRTEAGKPCPSSKLSQHQSSDRTDVSACAG